MIRKIKVTITFDRNLGKCSIEYMIFLQRRFSITIKNSFQYIFQYVALFGFEQEILISL